MSLRAALGSRLDSNSVLDGEADLMAYSYDAAPGRAKPDAVVLARNLGEIRSAVSACLEAGAPYVARGAGTNLSGGCQALRGGVVLSLARMTSILSIGEDGVAVVEPGVVNLFLQAALEAQGRFYAPDPASYRVCTIGGNIAENAGGPRCLKYGVTSNHVLAVEAVMPDGSTAVFSVKDPGPELLGLLVGSEGTLGIVSKAWLKTLAAPQSLLTALAGFKSIEDSMLCVKDMISAGLLPRALEAMDRATVESVEAYKPAGYPKSEAVLLIELDGLQEGFGADAAEIEKICRKHGCEEFRLALEKGERERLWEGRRGAYAAVARIAPNVLVEDGVVPRGALPQACRRVQEIAQRRKLNVPLLFHAGDGNLHPNIAYDERDASQAANVRAAGHEILKACVELGGSISGEHGIGADKRAAMSWLLQPKTLALMRRVKREFDPLGLANPDKVLPLPSEEASCLVKQRSLSPSAARAVRALEEAFKAKTPVLVKGRSTCLTVPQQEKGLELRVEGSELIEFDRDNLSIIVEAGLVLDDLAAVGVREGFCAPITPGRGTLGGLIASKAFPGLRDHILGMRIALANGDVVDLGAKTVKNVAGYDLAKTLLGSWGSLAVILDVTLKVYPKQIPVSVQRPEAAFIPNEWQRRLKAAFDPENRLNPWIFRRPA